MSDIQPDTSSPLDKALEANTEAETALKKSEPDVALAQAWAAVASNWLSMVDPRSPELRKLSRPNR